MREILTKWLVAGAIAMFAVWGACCSVREARRTARRLATKRRQMLAVFGAFAIVCCIEAQKRSGEEGETSRVERVEIGELTGDDGRALSPRAPYGSSASGESSAVACLYGALGESALPDASNRDCLVPNHCGADGVRALPVRGGAQGYSVTAEDVSRGWRVESVTTNAVFGYQGEYTNRVDNIDWRKHGGYKMRCRVDFGDFEFPYGDTTLNGAIALTGGTLWSLPTAGPRQVVCAGLGYASFVRQTSSFWSADADNGAKLLTWENVFSNRDLTGQYSAQIELRQNGDFMLRSNCVETVCRRINSDDSDGDGLPDDVDPNPTTWDGNYLGTSVAWYNAQCGNVLSAWDDDGVIRIEWNDGVCSNAYYWLDVIVSGARGKVTGTVRITCDGPSNLGNMIVIAPTNEVCHIPLLAGAGYVVESELPIASATASDNCAQVGGWNVSGKDARYVQLPLAFNIAAHPSDSSHYVLSSSPLDVGAAISSVSGICCNSLLCDGGFDWSCGDGCLCDGAAHDLWTVAIWEGYSRGFVASLACPCIGAPEPRLCPLSLSIPDTLFPNDDVDTFDHPAVGDEDYSTGRCLDDDLARCSVSLDLESNPANGTMRLYRPKPNYMLAYAGETVGLFLEEHYLEDIDPYIDWRVESGNATGYFRMDAAMTPMQYNGGYVRADWIPDAGEPVSVTSRFTIARCVAEPICSDLTNVFENGVERTLVMNPCGVGVGRDAYFKIDLQPSSYPDAKITWSQGGGGAVAFVGANANTGRVVRVRGVAPGKVNIEVSVGTCQSDKPTFPLYVVTNKVRHISVWIVGGEKIGPAQTEANIYGMLPIVNDVYSQTGVSFEIDSMHFITNDSACQIYLHTASTNDVSNSTNRSLTFDELVDSVGANDIKCFFIDKFRDSDDTRAATVHGEGKIVMTRAANALSLAHELGHVLGASDIYYARNSVDVIGEEFKWESAMDDWSNGCIRGGSGYYRRGTTSDEIVPRLLMYGYADEQGLRGRDMTVGDVYGVYNVNEHQSAKGDVNIGFRRTLEGGSNEN